MFGCVQMRLQPDEAIYMKIVVKDPGLEMRPTVSEMDLSYKQRYQVPHILLTISGYGIHDC